MSPHRPRLSRHGRHLLYRDGHDNSRRVMPCRLLALSMTLAVLRACVSKGRRHPNMVAQ